MAEHTSEGHDGGSAEVRMLHDIVRQFAHLPDGEAARAAADHVHSFWEERMQERLTRLAESEPELFESRALEAARTVAADRSAAR